MERPNILWIMADELRADALSCYGNAHPEISTPNIDELAASGVLFERAYTSSPVCVPARYAMLTGASPLNTGVLNNEGYAPEGHVVPEMFPETLARAGWSTTSYGKEHLPGGRSPWQHDDHTGSGMPELLDVARSHGADVRRSPGIGHVFSAVLPEGAELGSEAITRSVVQELSRNQGPFVLRASYVQPHKPMVVPEPWASKYAGLDFKLPRSPEAAGNEFEREWGRLTQGEGLTDEELNLSLQMYYGCVAWLDDQVGQILRALDESGLRDSTIVIFTTDHGASLGEYGMMAKHTFAPESHRVPFIISWPGTLPQGERRADLALSEDIAATVLALAGVEPPSTCRARNLFAGPAPEIILSAIGYGETSSRAFPARDAGAWGDGRGWPQRVCARTIRYRLDLNTRRAGQAVGDDEDIFLADSFNDPSERTNLANDERYRPIRDRLLDLARTAGRAIPPSDVREDEFAQARAAIIPI